MVGRLEGRAAVVTGGARGIGRGIVEAFAAEGADVAVADTLPEREAAAVLAEVERAGRRGVYVHTDVAEEYQVRNMVDTVLGAFGRIDVLVNNAGVLSQVYVEEMPVEEWDRVLRVNLRGTFLCCRYVLPHMLERGEGRILNIASQIGQSGAPGLAHYSASKGGVIAFTKALAREVAARGVLVNAIAPGPISTGIMPSQSEELEEARKAALPIRRFGTVDEVAPTAVFLASGDSSYYVGQTLGPNGGDVMF
ncbi:MAG TPA: 3-oxoacyl-ACP reductase family protein [Rubrobacteraceae bacterium]|nr:3-oxoacyl-ACP reductase family protein [Rubrobacteraceae bacterium]